jgi:hypothetical protein
MHLPLSHHLLRGKSHGSQDIVAINDKMFRNHVTSLPFQTMVQEASLPLNFAEIHYAPLDKKGIICEKR